MSHLLELLSFMCFILGRKENATTVSVEQLTDLRSDAFEALTAALDPLSNSERENASISEGVVTMSLQLMVDLSGVFVTRIKFCSFLPAM